MHVSHMGVFLRFRDCGAITGLSVCLITQTAETAEKDFKNHNSELHML